MFLCVCFTWTREQHYYDNTEIVLQQDGAPKMYISQVRNALNSHNPEAVELPAVTALAPLICSHALWLSDMGTKNNVSSRKAEVLRVLTNDRRRKIWESGLGQNLCPSIVNSVAESCPRCVEIVTHIWKCCNTAILKQVSVEDFLKWLWRTVYLKVAVLR
jgi:hypothetical protein